MSKVPCEKCIVSTMCQDPCNNLELYISNYFKHNRKYKFDNEVIQQASIALRRKKIVLCNNIWGYST
jgi:hypothetical protein